MKAVSLLFRAKNKFVIRLNHKVDRVIENKFGRKKF